MKIYLVLYRLSFCFLLFISSRHTAIAQEPEYEVFTRQDSLRGFLNKYRSGFDITHYDLAIRIEPNNQSISGKNIIYFKVLRELTRIQLDLFGNMHIDSVVYKNDRLSFEREGNAFFVDFPVSIPLGSLEKLHIYYNGKPVISGNPPWDGGFVWEKDSLNRPWIGVACEGTGASLWWPNKDHLSDEPDSMFITLESPVHLIAVSNGQLVSLKKLNDDYIAWKWKVSYPINNYNVTLNLAKYGHFYDYYVSGKDSLRLDYYVLDYNLDIAMEHFKQVKGMLSCFESYLGRFPFWEDGYKLVETPYWGMEHQSCVAYGNNYRNNNYGFDFIIIHESAHEYWGNAVSAVDHAELWIHESFTTYMEALYIEYRFDKTTAIEYLRDQRERIYNVRPILGPLHVNYDRWNDADMYYKGSWMLHSIRHTIGNDEKWFSLLKKTYQNFKYRQISSSDIIDFMNSNTEFNLEPIFRQYLTRTEIPVLKVKKKFTGDGMKLKYKWTETIKEFNMPVRILTSGGKEFTLYPTTKNQKITLNIQQEDNPEFSTDLFYFELPE